MSLISAIKHLLVKLIAIAVLVVLLGIGIAVILIGTGLGRMVLLALAGWLLWTHPSSWKVQLFALGVIALHVLAWLRVLQFQQYVKTYRGWQNLQKIEEKMEGKVMDAEFKEVKET